MKKEMLINVLQPEECRIAIVEDGVLEELYVERTSHESYVGNIYKGRIVNIEPSIQAAFVDFGVGRNGFLHVSDVEPAYYRHLEQRAAAGAGPPGAGARPRPRSAPAATPLRSRPRMPAAAPARRPTWSVSSPTRRCRAELCPIHTPVPQPTKRLHEEGLKDWPTADAEYMHGDRADHAHRGDFAHRGRRCALLLKGA